MFWEKRAIAFLDKFQSPRNRVVTIFPAMLVEAQKKPGFLWLGQCDRIIDSYLIPPSRRTTNLAK